MFNEIWREKAMRICEGCVYAKWMKNKVYCMFLGLPSCPKGKGDIMLFDESKRKKNETTDYPPTYEKLTTKGRKNTCVEHHEQIYRMRYVERKTLQEIARYFGLAFASLQIYMKKCDDEWIANGHPEWAEQKADNKIEVRNVAKGLTPQGNIPPYRLHPRNAVRLAKHPLRLNHDTIFNMYKDGYSMKEIADELDMSPSSLYRYIVRCENDWEDRQKD